jgi:hypothetical protein
MELTERNGETEKREKTARRRRRQFKQIRRKKNEDKIRK